MMNKFMNRAGEKKRRNMIDATHIILTCDDRMCEKKHREKKIEVVEEGEMEGRATTQKYRPQKIRKLRHFH